MLSLNYVESINIPLLARFGGSAAKQFLSNKLGVSLEASEYVKDIVIEDLDDPRKNNKDTIVCFDDLERKSNNISIIDLLGLIQRISERFNTIMIANISQLDDQPAFKTYREKVIDYEFKITEINNRLMKDILRQYINNLSKEQENTILEIYKRPFKRGDISIGNQLQNIRVYKKYVALIARVYKEMKSRLHPNECELGNEVFESCKTVICHYYFNDNIDYGFSKTKGGVSPRDGGLNKTIYSILRYESYDAESFKDLILYNSEISKDIKSLNRIYEYSHEQAEKLLDKIQAKIKEKDLNYFLRQANVISLFGSLSNFGLSNTYSNELLEISNSLYIPGLGEHVPFFDSDERYDIIFRGEVIPCSKAMRNFIDKINNNNRNVYLEYLNKEFGRAFSHMDIRMPFNILKYIPVNTIEHFERVFSFAEKELDSVNNSEVW